MIEGNDFGECPSAEELIDDFIADCEREAAKLEMNL